MELKGYAHWAGPFSFQNFLFARKALTLRGEGSSQLQLI